MVTDFDQIHNIISRKNLNRKEMIQKKKMWKGKWKKRVNLQGVCFKFHLPTMPNYQNCKFFCYISFFESVWKGWFCCFFCLRIFFRTKRSNSSQNTKQNTRWAYCWRNKSFKRTRQNMRFIYNREWYKISISNLGRILVCVLSSENK